MSQETEELLRHICIQTGQSYYFRRCGFVYRLEYLHERGCEREGLCLGLGPKLQNKDHVLAPFFFVVLFWGFFAEKHCRPVEHGGMAKITPLQDETIDLT